MSIRVLLAAWRDLEDIKQWVTENFGAAAADRTYTQLFKSFRLLADFPETFDG